MKELIVGQLLPTSVLLFGIVALTTQGIAASGSDHRRRNDLSPALEKRDLDKDGIITRSEFLDGVRQDFVKMDSNKDGRLTHDEIRAAEELNGK
jgi:Ca2+-binding EF-hand superfamily protein